MCLKNVPKSLMAFVLIAGIVSSFAFAQTRKHDLSVSYGAVSFDQLADILTDVLTIVITLGTFSKRDVTYSGVPFFTYHYSRNSRFGFGLSVGTYQSEGDLYLLEENRGAFKETNVIGALEFDYHWLMKKGFQMYSGAGVGVRLRKGTYHDLDSTETASKALPTFHVNLLGFRVGRTIGFFGEAGFGYKGLFNAGLNAQF